MAGGIIIEKDECRLFFVGVMKVYLKIKKHYIPKYLGES